MTNLKGKPVDAIFLLKHRMQDMYIRDYLKFLYEAHFRVVYKNMSFKPSRMKLKELGKDWWKYSKPM